MSSSKINQYDVDETIAKQEEVDGLKSDFAELEVELFDTRNMDRLWENASPSSNFVEQTLAINNENYTRFLIVYAFNKSNGWNGVSTKLCLKGMRTFLDTALGLNYWRAITINNNAFIFERGCYQSSFGSWEGTGNDNCTPLQIYGIK